MAVYFHIFIGSVSQYYMSTRFFGIHEYKIVFANELINN